MLVEKKNVTLGDIITLFDGFYNIRIWVDYDDIETYNEEETPDWEGAILDIPWTYLDYIVNNIEGRGIRIGTTKDKGEPFFVINLKEPEN